MFDAKEVSRYLPKYTKIAKTPDRYNFSVNQLETNLNYEEVELKTIDILNKLNYLQERALQEAARIKSEKDRKIAMGKIMNMSFFKANNPTR